MSKFLVLYRVPLQGLDDWMKTDPATREASEKDLKAKWDAWMTEHQGAVAETSGAGKTKRVDASGTSDTRNDIMLYSVVEAESQEAATKLFEGHPHLEIPGAWIEVTAANTLPGMQ